MRTISDALGLDYKKVYEMSCNSSNRYQYLATSSDPASHEILRDSHMVSGVVIVDKQVRQ